jgi:hypothetical protein
MRRGLDLHTLCPADVNEADVRCEVFTAVTMKNVVCWDVTPCGSCKNRRTSSQRATVARGNVAPSLLILLILMMEMISSFETSVLTRVTRRHIPEDDIPHITGYVLRM